MSEKDQNNRIDLRLKLEKKSKLYQAFKKIKKSTGIKNNSEVLRFILKQISKFNFDDFVKIDPEQQPQVA